MPRQTLPLSGRQGHGGSKAKSCWRSVHSLGVFEVSLPTDNTCRPSLHKQILPLPSSREQGNHLSSMTTVNMKITIGSK
jgi:hypothetical protein